VNLTNSQWPNKNAQSALILILTTELSTVNSEMASSRYQYKASAPMQSTKNEGIDLRSFSCGSPKIVESPSIITEAPCEIAENRRIAVKNHRIAVRNRRIAVRNRRIAVKNHHITVRNRRKSQNRPEQGRLCTPPPSQNRNSGSLGYHKSPLSS